MGAMRKAQSRKVEVLESLATMPSPAEESSKLGSCCGGCRWEWEGASRDGLTRKGINGGTAGGGMLPVCVTSAASYIGRAVVECLLKRGYAVRLAVDSQDDLENMREMEALEGMEEGKISVATADLTDADGLCRMFDGCAGVFHTSAFLDTAGISGYTRHMAEMEVAAAAKVVEACARTPSVRRCVFTSSLLACVWRRPHHHLGHLRTPAVLDDGCWSDETLCRDKKLWLALGKTMAERAAWRAARDGDVKLAALCPGLLTGPGFSSRNASSSVAYLKGGAEMYAAALLATVEVRKAAEAHVCVYEAMFGGGAGGRYICFDRVLCGEEEAAELGRQLGLAKPLSSGARGDDGATTFVLSNGKLRRQIMSRNRCVYEE